MIAGDNWDRIPLVQSGQGLVGYRGSTRYQRGKGIGSILRTIFRAARPIARRAARAVAKEGIEQAALIGSDLLEGENMKTSLKKRAKQGASNLARKAVKKADNMRHPHARGYRRIEESDDDDEAETQKGGAFGFKKKSSVKTKRKYKQIGFGLKNVPKLVTKY